MRGAEQAGPPADWREELRTRGYRLTPQRQLVLEAVQELEHATPDAILGHVRDRAGGVNISTIYRTLELLEDLGLVRHTHISDRAPTYHSTAGPDHLHLVCRACGKVTEVSPDVVAATTARLAEEYAFTTDIGHLTVFGWCRGCLPEGAD